MEARFPAKMNPKTGLSQTGGDGWLEQELDELSAWFTSFDEGSVWKLYLPAKPIHFAITMSCGKHDRNRISRLASEVWNDVLPIKNGPVDVEAARARQRMASCSLELP